MDANKFYSDIKDEAHRRKSVEEDLNLRLRQQEAIAWIGEYAIRAQDIDALFQETARVISETLDMEYCKILELLPGGRELLLRAGVGWREGLVGSAQIGAGTDSQAGYTLLAEEPVIVTDLQTETRFSGEDLLFSHHVASGMTVVIPGKEKPFGVLGTHTTKRKQFMPYDTRFIKGIAGILGSAVERFRAEEELRRSRDELSIILNGVSEGIVVQDTNSKMVFANRAGAIFLGYDTVQDLLEATSEQVRDHFELFDENGNQLPVDAFPSRQVLKGEPKASLRIHFRISQTGEDHWSITDATPILDAEGRIIQTVSIFRDITEMVRTEEHRKLLIEAGELLASSLDYETTLANVTQLVVKNLADWCSVHLLTEQNEPYRVSVAHKDPSKVALVLELERRYPTDPQAESGLTRVLRTGKPEFVPELPDSALVKIAQDAEHLEVLRKLQIRSGVVLPLIARGRPLGALSLVWAESGRTYTQAEVNLAEELANRAALAIENARLYQEAQSLNANLEQRVATRTRQLEISTNHLLKEIEERKKAESALRKSETLLNSLFESAPYAIILVGPGGQIVRVNRQAEDIFQYGREELVGSPVDILLPERFRGGYPTERSNSFLHMASRSMGVGMDLWAIRRDGTEFPIDILLSPVQTDDGELVIGAIRDITEQKRLQTELDETHRRLFESIEAERLLVSQELHDGPIQELYGVALELESVKSMLAAADGQESSPAESVEELEAMGENVQAIIQTLRSVCSDLRPPVLNQFGLEKAIRSHLMKLQESHPELHITAQLINDGSRLTERIRLALYRVYQNAISNVIRHAQANNIYVEFKLDADRILLQIQDDGRGFVKPKRWVELVRGGHFGLAGIAERVEALGGQVAIESAPGRGTTIRVELPMSANM